MALNLTHYEKVYNEKFKIALSFAEKCLEAMGQRPPDMAKQFVTVLTMKNINGHKGYYQEVCMFLGSIMFSSGYWHTNTMRKQKNGNLNITFQISIMTDSERKDNLEIDYDALLEEFDDDSYSSDDEVETV